MEIFRTKEVRKMAWIELHQTLPSNRKTMRLKRLLKIKTPQAVGHMCMLWLWAVDNAADGDLTRSLLTRLQRPADIPGKIRKRLWTRWWMRTL